MTFYICSWVLFVGHKGKMLIKNIEVSHLSHSMPTFLFILINQNESIGTRH